MALVDSIKSLLGVSTYKKPPMTGIALHSPQIERVREQMGGQIQPLPTTRLRWYLADLETAAYSADRGQLQLAGQISRAMMVDGEIRGLLGTLSSGVAGLPKRFYGDTELVSQLRALNGSRSVFEDMCPPAEQELMIADGIKRTIDRNPKEVFIKLGAGVGELRAVPGRDFPVLVRMDPEFLWYMWAEDQWYYNSVAGLIPVTPGMNGWVLHLPGGRLAPWQYGLWRTLGRAFINKEHALMHRSNYSAKLANPARAGVAPIGATEEQRGGFIQNLISWGINTVFELPVGWDVKLIESNGRGYEVFQQEIDTSDNEIMIAIAGQVVTTTGGAGFSNANVHEVVKQDIIRTVAESWDYTLNTQVIPQWVVGVAGEGAITNAPIIKRDVDRPKDKEAEARTQGLLAQAVTSLTEALKPYGKAPDVVELTTRFGVPITDEMPEEPEPPPTPKGPVQIPNPKAQALAHFHAGEFKESDHPRKGDGKFGSGGGGKKEEKKHRPKDLDWDGLGDVWLTDVGFESKEIRTALQHLPFDVSPISKESLDAVRKLPTEQRKTLLEWGGSAKKIHQHELGKADNAEFADRFNKALDVLPNHEGILYRGMSMSSDFLDRIKPGSEQTFDRTSSYTTDPRIASKFSATPSAEKSVPGVLIVEAKTGKSVDFGKGKNGRGESEVLMRKGAKVKVLQKRELPDGSVLIHCKEV